MYHDFLASANINISLPTEVAPRPWAQQATVGDAIGGCTQNVIL